MGNVSTLGASRAANASSSSWKSTLTCSGASSFQTVSFTWTQISTPLIGAHQKGRSQGGGSTLGMDITAIVKGIEIFKVV